MTAVPPPPPEPADHRTLTPAEPADHWTPAPTEPVDHRTPPSPAARSGRSHRSGTTAGLLQLFPGVVLLGGFGRLYTGHTSLGVAQLLTGVVIGWGTICASSMAGFPATVPTAAIVFCVWAWYLVDALALIFGRPEDGDGRRLRP